MRYLITTQNQTTINFTFKGPLKNQKQLHFILNLVFVKQVFVVYSAMVYGF